MSNNTNSGFNQADPETQEMLKSFVSEAFDSLDTNEPIVDSLRLDDNFEAINAIFRVFHTLKGLSGFFGMEVIRRVTHEAETLLDILRKKNERQGEEVITVIYQTFDFLRDLLQRVSAEFTDSSAEAESEDMILILKDSIEKVKSGNQTPKDEFISLGDFEPVSSREESATEELPIETQTIESDSDVPDIDYSALISGEMLEQFLTSAFELVDLAEKDLLEIEKDPHNVALIGETFGAIHSLKGNSGFMGFSEIEEISIEMETILDSIRNNELDAEQNIITILLSNIETVRKRLEKIAKKSSDSENRIEEYEVEPVAQKQKPIEQPAKITANKETVKGKPAPKPEKEQQKEEPAAEDEEDSTTPETAKSVKKKDGLSTGIPQIQRKDIRVETSKIDKLFSLVGELITIETMVTDSPDLKGHELPNFNKSANMLNKITRELQEISMLIRMMPLEGLFNKMKRLVRDVSIKMKKKVNLTVSGQETEMDKNVIDEISDPLVHILRNAIDHGVETPEVRSAKGKNEVGNVLLAAHYEGNEILITVQDDGAGLDRQKLLKKAEERGLLSIPPEKMTDKEVYALIFEPGFSTADKVTDISGRGVGMDVVKKNIDKLRGRVTVDSVQGKGSTITLRIPLTLAILEAMVIRVGKARYALPILSLKEAFRTTKGRINITMDGLEVVKVRNDILPIIRLHELFHVEPDSRELDKGILIIIELRDHQVCLFADEIVGQQQAVIKSLSEYIGKVKGLTGCMVLGDGGIGLILDVESLIDMAEKPLN
ncbi:MAG: two-component system, chemotaxis family, sensor kinase CheA [Bacteroidota bacterium]|nr:two-component system, chemotaxis family, sensor kinase CheA [Bacteroidota bacterium]